MNTTEEERHFMVWHDGFMEFMSGRLSPKQEAMAGAKDVVNMLTERYPNRAERLLVFSMIAAQAQAARDAVLDDLMHDEAPGWYEEGGVWYARHLPVQDHEMRELASLAGLSVVTVRTRHKKWVRQTFEEAKSKAEQQISV